MSAPITHISPATANSPGPGIAAEGASNAGPVVVDGGADQPFAIVLHQIAKTLGLSGGAKLTDAQTASGGTALETFQNSQDPAALAGAAVVAALAAATGRSPTVTADGATPALAADVGKPIDLAALLAQLSPASRRATMASHAGDQNADVPKDAGDGTVPGTLVSADALAGQVVAAPIAIPSQIERSAEPQPDKTMQGRLSAARDLGNSTANAGKSTVPIGQSAGTVADGADPKVVAAGETTNAPAIVAGTASSRPTLAAQPAANADHGNAFETILAHTQGDNNAAAIATAQAETSNKIAATMQNSTPALVVSTPVGNANWAAEVSDKLVWMVGRQEQRVELVLNPPQLGRVEVSLSLNGDQATAQFLSANPVVREALESAMPRLREMLADGGITLGQTNVGSDSSEQTANQRENGDNPASFGSGSIMFEAPLRAGNAATQWLGRGRGIVDVFA
jgi:flagellar hook-length control protein FliK